jgi:hypothetical protein
MTFLSPASGDRQFSDEGKHSVLGHMPKLYPESYPSAPQNAVGTTKLWAWGGQLEPRSGASPKIKKCVARLGLIWRPGEHLVGTLVDKVKGFLSAVPSLWLQNANAPSLGIFSGRLMSQFKS